MRAELSKGGSEAPVVIYLVSLLPHLYQAPTGGGGVLRREPWVLGGRGCVVQVIVWVTMIGIQTPE